MSNFCNFKILKQKNIKPRFLDLSFESKNYGIDDWGEI